MKKTTLFVLIVAAMLLVATVGVISLTPVPTDEKIPLLKASSSDPTQQAIDRARNTNTGDKDDPTQQAIDRARGTQQSPIDPFTVVFGLGIGATILYRYRRK